MAYWDVGHRLIDCIIAFLELRHDLYRTMFDIDSIASIWLLISRAILGRVRRGGVMEACLSMRLICRRADEPE